MKTLPFALLALSLSQTQAAEVVSGLSAKTSECKIADRAFSIRELELKPGRGLELRALTNPSARRNPQCHDGYGGHDLPYLLRSLQTMPDFAISGATNGTVFREVPGGYASNSLLWSKGTGLVAPLRRAGGNSLFVADPRGGHALKLSFVDCAGPDACLRVPGLGRPLKAKELIRHLHTQYPQMTLALQSNMPLMDGHPSAHDGFTHWSQCPADRPGDWRCRSLPRTVLCAKAHGEISLLAVTASLPLDLAQGLRTGGECGTQCVNFYNLDGGRSTQMAERRAGRGDYELTGYPTLTTQPGCSDYRPVHNYLVVGKPRGN